MTQTQTWTPVLFLQLLSDVQCSCAEGLYVRMQMSDWEPPDFDFLLPAPKKKLSRMTRGAHVRAQQEILQGSQRASGWVDDTSYLWQMQKWKTWLCHTRAKYIHVLQTKTQDLSGDFLPCCSWVKSQLLSLDPILQTSSRIHVWKRLITLVSGIISCEKCVADVIHFQNQVQE